MNDDELGQDARSFVDAALRGEPAVGGEARARMRSRMLGALAGGAAAGGALTTAGAGAAAATKSAAAAPTGATFASSLLAKGVIALLVVGVSIGGARYALRSEAPPVAPAPTRPSVPAEPATPTAIPDPPAPAAVPVPVPVTALPSPRATVAAATPATASSHAAFSEELALLERARRATTAGNQTEALEALARMDRLPGAGAFAEEHDALRIVALCSGGRADDGRAALAGFRASFPRSLHTERVVRACRE